MTLCEIRVPTFRRHKLLERALLSVLSQTHRDWRCMVLDDCPDASARSVVSSFHDERLIYLRNERALGAIGNIDRAFINRPIAGGTWALVLEDDNYLLPDHLQTQLETARSAGVSVTFSAQLVEEIIEPGQPGHLTRAKTIAWIYPEGRHSPVRLLPSVLFSHAFSNGSVFWRIGCASNFEIGDHTDRPGIQETLRILKLRDDVFVSHRATAVWRSNDPRDSYVSRRADLGLQGKLFVRWQQLLELREINDYRCWYIERFGTADAINFARRLQPMHAIQIDRALLRAGRSLAITKAPLRWRWMQIARGKALRALVPRQLHLEQFCVIPLVPSIGPC